MHGKGESERCTRSDIKAIATKEKQKEKENTCLLYIEMFIS